MRFINTFRLILILFLLPAAVSSQLLRPVYNKSCPDFPIERFSVNRTYIIGDIPPEEAVVDLVNDNDLLVLSPNVSGDIDWYDISDFNNQYINLEFYDNAPLGEYYDTLTVMAKFDEDCFDTIAIISIELIVSNFSKIKWFSRLELGYISNNVSYSVQSIQGDENYSLGANPGWLVGLDVFELRTHPNLLSFGLIAGIVYRQAGISGTYIGAASEVSSTSDLSVSFSSDLPFGFINRDLRDLSFATYLTLPLMSYSTVQSAGATQDINDQLSLNLSYGLGLRYTFFDTFLIEGRLMLNEFESINSTQERGSKIAFEAIRSEITLSVTNFSERFYGLF